MLSVRDNEHSTLLPLADSLQFNTRQLGREGLARQLASVRGQARRSLGEILVDVLSHESDDAIDTLA